MLLIATSASDPNGETEGITLVQAGESDASQTAVAAERVEAFEQEDRSLAQIWLVAFGAGAFFLLELVSPLGIFYPRPTRGLVSESRAPRFPATERLRIRQRRRLSAST